MLATGKSCTGLAVSWVFPAACMALTHNHTMISLAIALFYFRSINQSNKRIAMSVELELELPFCKEWCKICP